MRLYCAFSLLSSTTHCPFSLKTHPVDGDAEIQDTIPSVITLSFRTTRNQGSNCVPILTTVRLYRILQLGVFVFTRTSSRQGDAGIQDIMPSLITLSFRSTRNGRCNCNPTYLALLTERCLTEVRKCMSILVYSEIVYIFDSVLRVYACYTLVIRKGC
jgi:hypothetical protein